MAKTITLAEEVHRELSKYGNRDESYNTIVLRLLNNMKEEEAQKDRMERKTVFQKDDKAATGNPAAEALDDGTVVRFKIEQGKYAGEQKTGTVSGSRIEYEGDTWSPTGMAREADQDIRGSDARDSGAYSGPREVEYQNESGEWVPLQSILE